MPSHFCALPLPRLCPARGLPVGRGGPRIVPTPAFTVAINYRLGCVAANVSHPSQAALERQPGSEPSTTTKPAGF